MRKLPYKIIHSFENRPQVGHVYSFRHCVGGYFLPPELEGQRGRVTGTEQYSFRVRSLGKEWVLPSQLIDSGMTYVRSDGRRVDRTDRQVAKLRARSLAHLDQVELRRALDSARIPF